MGRGSAPRLLLPPSCLLLHPTVFSAPPRKPSRPPVLPPLFVAASAAWPLTIAWTPAGTPSAVAGVVDPATALVVARRRASPAPSPCRAFRSTARLGCVLGHLLGLQPRTPGRCRGRRPRRLAPASPRSRFPRRLPALRLPASLPRLLPLRPPMVSPGGGGRSRPSRCSGVFPATSGFLPGDGGRQHGGGNGPPQR